MSSDGDKVLALKNHFGSLQIKELKSVLKKLSMESLSESTFRELLSKCYRNELLTIAEYRAISRKDSETEQHMELFSHLEKCTQIKIGQFLVTYYEIHENDTIFEKIFRDINSTQTASTHTDERLGQEQEMTDFSVSDAHVLDISAIISQKMDHATWERIMKSMLSNADFCDINRESTLQNKVYKTVETWASTTKRSKRNFSDLIQHLKKQNLEVLCDTLVEKSKHLALIIVK